jgi:hypothetical protein
MSNQARPDRGCANYSRSASRFVARARVSDPKINRSQKLQDLDQAAVGTLSSELRSDDLAMPETGMASQLASAWPRKLAAPAGGFDQASRVLGFSRTISSRSNFEAARFNRVALGSHLCDDQKIHEYQRLVIIARLDPCPWGPRVVTNPAVAAAPGAGSPLDSPDHDHAQSADITFSQVGAPHGRWISRPGTGLKSTVSTRL